VNVHLRCIETEEMVGSAQESVVGLEISTSSGKQKRMFGCVYPHSGLCGRIVEKELVCKDGYEIVGLHGVFCVSKIPQYCTHYADITDHYRAFTYEISDWFCVRSLNRLSFLIADPAGQPMVTHVELQHIVGA